MNTVYKIRYCLLFLLLQHYKIIHVQTYITLKFTTMKSVFNQFNEANKQDKQRIKETVFSGVLLIVSFTILIIRVVNLF